MDIENIKQYVEQQVARSDRLIPSERTASYYEDQLALRQLWLQAEQTEALQVIAGVLIEISEKGKKEKEVVSQ